MPPPAFPAGAFQVAAVCDLDLGHAFETKAAEDRLGAIAERRQRPLDPAKPFACRQYAFGRRCLVVAADAVNPFAPYRLAAGAAHLGADAIVREIVGHAEQISTRIGHRRRPVQPIGFQPEILKYVFGIASAACVQEAEQGTAIFEQVRDKDGGRHADQIARGRTGASPAPTPSGRPRGGAPSGKNPARPERCGMMHSPLRPGWAMDRITAAVGQAAFRKCTDRSYFDDAAFRRRQNPRPLSPTGVQGRGFGSRPSRSRSVHGGQVRAQSADREIQEGAHLERHRAA